MCKTMNWSTIWICVNLGLSIASLIAVVMYIKVTNKCYKLRDDHIAELKRINTYQLDVIKLQKKAIEVLRAQASNSLEKDHK